MSSQIVLYNGIGSGPFCTYALQNRLEDIIDNRKYCIKKISTISEIISHPESVSALFVPGGNAAQMFISERFEECNQQIKEIFNRYSISYYGACAGGILAAKSLHDQKIGDFDGSLEFFCKPRAFCDFFPASAVGPMFPKSPPGAPVSIKDVKIKTILLRNNTSLSSVQILGPGYLDVAGLNNCEMLASYDSTIAPIKLVERQFIGSECLFEVVEEIDKNRIVESAVYRPNQNRAVLVTGSHPEINSEEVASGRFKLAFSPTNQEQEKLVQELKIDDQKRRDLMKDYFEKIGLSCKED